MRRLKVCAVVGELVHFDDDQSGDQKREGQNVEAGVREGSGALLRCRVSGLEE